MKEMISCPVCKSESKIIYDLPRDYLKDNLERYFNVTINEDLNLIAYEMAACSNCTLTFAHPLVEGSGAFYSWITRQEAYYPTDRWEYHKVYDILNNNKSGSLSLVDVGCGSGEFLELLKPLKNVKAIGVDPTQTSIDKCRNKGVDGYCLTLEDFLKTYERYKNSFDYIVSFHCLEHIGAPLDFLDSMLQALKPGGSILISTPYSPMSFETDWFDPLNHPPHHMGRWNTSAYRKLGEKLNLDVTFHMPKSRSLLQRTITAFFYSKMDFRKYSHIRFLKLFLRFPGSFYKHMVIQRGRAKVNGETAADVVLVEFKAKR